MDRPYKTGTNGEKLIGRLRFALGASFLEWIFELFVRAMLGLA